MDRSHSPARACPDKLLQFLLRTHLAPRKCASANQRRRRTAPNPEKIHNFANSHARESPNPTNIPRPRFLPARPAHPAQLNPPCPAANPDRPAYPDSPSSAHPLQQFQHSCCGSGLRSHNSIDATRYIQPEVLFPTNPCRALTCSNSIRRRSPRRWPANYPASQIAVRSDDDSAKALPAKSPASDRHSLFPNRPAPDRTSDFLSQYKLRDELFRASRASRQTLPCSP